MSSRPVVGRRGAARPGRFRLLLVEDSEDDARLLVHELRDGGYDPVCLRVETVGEMEAALDAEEPWDVIVSDYLLPAFGALEALEIVRRRGLDVPFVVVSGAVGEETAAEVMRRGAHDFIVKANLARLNAVIARELRDARVRREAQSALQAREKRFEALVRNSSDLVVLLDADGTILYESPSVERVLGFKPEERVGKNAFGYLHPEDRERVREELARITQSGGISPAVEYRVRDREGRWRRFEAVGNNLLSEPGVEALVVNSRDVTERREAEEARRLGELRFRALSEATEEGVAFHEGGRIVDANDAFASMFGYAGPEEVIGLPLRTFAGPTLSEDDPYLFEGVEGVPYEAYGSRASGRTFPVRAVDREGAYMGRPVRVTVARDLTEQKQAEEALRESEERFRATFEQAAVGIVQVDVNGNWLRFNDRFCEIVGYEREELSRTSVFRLIPPEDLEREFDRGLRMVAGELREYQQEMQIVRGDGSRGWIAVTVYLVYDDAGEQRYFIGVAEDINRRKLIEEELRLRDRAVAASTNGIVITDPNLYDSPIVYANPAFERMTGYAVEEVLGKNCRFLQGDDRDQPALEELRSALREGRPCTVELRNYRKDGTPFWNELTVSPVHDESGRVTHHVGVQNDVTERREAEEARRRTLRELADMKFALDESAIVAFTDVMGTITYANDKFCEVSGYSREELIGQNHRLVNSGHHPKEYIKELWRTIAQGRVWRGEIRNRRKDGGHYWVDTTIVPFLDEGGRPYQYVAIRYDITERKEAEEAAREAEGRFRTLVEQLPAVTYVQETSGFKPTIYVSPQAQSILGYSPEEDMLDVRNWERRIHPDDRERILAEDERTDETGEPFRVEYRLLGGDGRMRWVRDEAVLVRDEAGEPLYWLGVQFDITERKRAEEALRDSEERYRTVVEQATECIFIADAETGAVLQANAAFRRLLGYEAGELSGLTLFDFVAHERESIEENTRRAVKDGGRRIGERRYRRKDGSLVNVEVGANALRQGERDVLCVVSHDITQRKKTEESLRRSLSVLLALREAGQLLSSTLESEEIVSRLLNVMRGVSELTAAVISTPEEDLITNGYSPDGDDAENAGAEGASVRFRVWRSSGLEGLWAKARYAPEAEETRRSVLLTGRREFFLLKKPGEDGGAEEVMPALYLPLRSRDHTLGVLEAYGTSYLEADDAAELLESLAAQAASALENARLYGELAERERRLQELVGKILVAQEEERRRVAYEVHDGLAQAAAAAHQRLQSFAYRHPPASEAGARDLQRALGLVQRTVRDARKVIANLRPTVLDDFGLAAAVRHEVEELREEGWQVEYEEELGPERLPVVVETSLFRVAQEAITNAKKHAGTERARLELVRQGGGVRLTIRDYGYGFDPEEAARSGRGPGERVGLSGMQERVHMLGGALNVRSSPGEGTTVEAIVPLPEDKTGRPPAPRELPGLPDGAGPWP